LLAKLNIVVRVASGHLLPAEKVAPPLAAGAAIMTPWGLLGLLLLVLGRCSAKMEEKGV